MDVSAIVIYADEGAVAVCIDYCIKMLQFEYPKSVISRIMAEELIEGKWVSETDLLVMPGGADRPYHKKLHGSGVEIIRQFVEGGGKYLGICAGAYFASSFIEFNKGVENVLQLCAERFLKLFKGIAFGPLYEGFEEYSEKGATIIPICYGKDQKVNVYYNGGCSFVDTDNCYDDSNFIASYDNGMNAFFFDTFGKGKVILCGPHIELDIEWCNKLLDENQKIDFEEKRKQFVQFIFSHF